MLAADEAHPQKQLAASRPQTVGERVRGEEAETASFIARVGLSLNVYDEGQSDGVLAGVVAEDRPVSRGDLGREPLVDVVGLGVEGQGRLDVLSRRFG